MLLLTVKRMTGRRCEATWASITMLRTVES